MPEATASSVSADRRQDEKRENAGGAGEFWDRHSIFKISRPPSTTPKVPSWRCHIGHTMRAGTIRIA